MKVFLSGGKFGGDQINWSSNAKIISVLYEGNYWNYDISLHDDNSLRADFCGCSTIEQGTIITVNIE